MHPDLAAKISRIYVCNGVKISSVKCFNTRITAQWSKDEHSRWDVSSEANLIIDGDAKALHDLMISDSNNYDRDIEFCGYADTLVQARTHKKKRINKKWLKKYGMKTSSRKIHGVFNNLSATINDDMVDFCGDVANFRFL